MLSVWPKRTYFFFFFKCPRSYINIAKNPQQPSSAFGTTDLQQTIGTLEHSDMGWLIATQAPAEEQLSPEQSGNLSHPESQVPPTLIVLLNRLYPRRSIWIQQEGSGGREEEKSDTRAKYDSNSTTSEVDSENNGNKEEKDDESDEDVASESYESASESKEFSELKQTGKTILGHDDAPVEAGPRWCFFPQ